MASAQPSNNLPMESETSPSVQELSPPGPTSPGKGQERPATAIGAAYELGRVTDEVQDLRTLVTSLSTQVESHLAGHDERVRELVDAEIVATANAALAATEEPEPNTRPMRGWEKLLGGR